RFEEKQQQTGDPLMSALCPARLRALPLCLALLLTPGLPAVAQAPTAPSSDPLGVEPLAALRERVDELRRQTERLQDSKAIKRLQRSFGYYFDAGLWDEMAALFSADATLEYARDGVYQGRERIRAYFYALGGGRKGLAEGQLNEHFQLMPVISLAEDGLSAQGRWRDLSLQGTLGEYAWWGEGPYENQYRKEDGVWKISRMQWFQTMLVPYEDGGWGRNP